MAEKFMFRGEADLGPVTQEVNQAIKQIEDRVNQAVKRTRAGAGQGRLTPAAFGSEMGRIFNDLERLRREFVRTGQASDTFFNSLGRQVQSQAYGRFKPNPDAKRPAEAATRRGFDLMTNTSLKDLKSIRDEQSQYLNQLRLRREAMELSVREERERLARRGVVNTQDIKLANLVTEEARVQAEINAMEKIRAAQVKRATQMNLRSTSAGYSEFVQISGEGEAMERQTAARVGLAAEREMAKNAQEMAEISGKRKALEQRRLAAERFATQMLLANDEDYIRDSGESRELERQTAARKALAGERLAAENLQDIAQVTGERKALEARRLAAEKLAAARARPDLRDATLRDEAAANNIRDRDNIRRSAYEEQGRTGDVGRRFALQEQAQAKLVNELQDSVAKQSAISATLAENRELVEREVVERKRALALRRAYESEALAGPGGNQIRELNAREAVAKQRQVALQEAATRAAAENLSDEERIERFATATANLQAREVETRQRKLITLLSSTQSEIRAEDIGDTVTVLEGQIAAAKRRQKDAIEEATRKEFARQNLALSSTALPYGPQPTGNQTGFQRLYSNLHGRQMAGFGGAGGAAPTLGQFLGSRALSTVGFALGGSLAFGAMAGVGKMVKEAEELELQLNILQAQFKAVGAEHSFGQVRDGILDVSRATGIAADEIAQLTVQFAGVFRTAGEPDPAIIDQATRVAGELAKIGDIQVTEIYDDLIAGARAFSDEDTAEALFETEKRLSNIVVQARNVSGVDIKETLDFVGRSGAVGRAAGLDMQEINAIGATLLQGSSMGGAALAEQFNRIITDFGAFSVELLKLTEDYPELAEAMGQSGIEAVAAGDAKALIKLADAYQDLDQTTRQRIIRDVGGRREGQTLAALFENASTLEEVMANANGEGNTRQEEFQKRLETLSETFDQLIVRLQKMSLALFEAGIADMFKDAADAAAILVEGVTTLLGLFIDVNEATGGMLGNILAMTAALKVLRALGLTSALAGGLGRLGGAGAGAFGGLLGAPGALRQGSLRAGAIYQGARLSGAGRFGASAQLLGAGVRGSALLGSVAPAAAAALTMEAGSRYFGMRNDIKDQGNQLRDQMAGRFAEVTSRQALEDLRQQVDDLPESSFIDKTATTLAGSNLAEAIPKDELQQQTFDAFGKKQAEALLGASNVELEALGAASGLSGADADDLRWVIEQYMGDPKDDDFAEIFEGLTSSARESRSALTSDLNPLAGGGLGALGLVGRIEERFFKRVQDTAELAQGMEELGSAEHIADTQEMLRGYDVGEVSFGQVEGALREDIAKYDRMIEVARRLGNEDGVLVLLEEQAKVRDNLLKTIKTNLSRSQGVESLIAEMTGNAGSELDAEQALERLTTLSDAGAPVDELLSEAASVISGYKQIALDRIEAAETEAEKIALLDQGFEIPQQAREAIAGLIVSSDTSRDLFRDVADTVGESAAAVRGAVEDALIDLNMAGVEAMQSMLREALALQMVALSQARSLGEIIAISREIGDISSQIEALGDLGSAVPQTGTFSDKERESALGSSGSEKKTDLAAIIKARRDYQLALAGDDPIKAAQTAIADAQTDYEFAAQEGDQAAMYSALAAKVRAQRTLQEAYAEVSSAQRDLAVAQAGDDPVAAARAALADADQAVQLARGAAEQAQAMADRIRSEKALQEALFDLFASQMDIVIATAESTGDSVGVAQAQLDLINEQIRKADELGLSEADRNRLEAERARGEAAVRDAVLGEQRATIDYQLAIGDITQGQAIAALQSLLAIPNLTEEQIRELNLEIKRMRDSLGQDFQFNLPTELALPTIYEARRLNQQGGSVSGGGTSSYQDNRQIQVSVQVSEPGASAEEIGAVVAQVVGDPSRSGTLARRY